MKRVLLGYCLLVFLTASSAAWAQSSFRHLQYNQKIKRPETHTVPAPKEVSGSVPASALHPANKRTPSSLKAQRRKRTHPQSHHASSSELYLDIRRGHEMEHIRAQNRRMQTGK